MTKNNFFLPIIMAFIVGFICSGSFNPVNWLEITRGISATILTCGWVAPLLLKYLDGGFSNKKENGY